MHLLYKLLIYLLLPIFLPFFIFRYITRKGYRYNIMERLGYYHEEKTLNINSKMVIWLHSVSVGEVIASIPLVLELKKRYPHHFLLMSTVTDTGRATALNKIPYLDAVIYFPLDFSFSANRAIDKIKPKIFIMLETEIWPNFLGALKRRGIPAILINGRISDRSYKRYLLIRFFIKNVLKNISAFGMQSAIDVERIINMGAEKKSVERTGNLKFELDVKELADDEIRHLRRSLNILDESDIFLAGSTHRGEDEVVIKAYIKMLSALKNSILIIAPRHLERLSEIESMLEKYKLPFIRKTMIKNDTKAEGKIGNVILLDTIGELSNLYSIASVVFVGGSLVPVGGHNILEPAIYKKPILFGPYMHNFREIAGEFKNMKACVEVSNADEIAKEIIHILKNPEIGKKLGESGFSVVVENRGALEKSAELIGRFL